MKRILWLIPIIILIMILGIYQEKRIYDLKVVNLRKTIIIDSLDCELQNSLNFNTRYEISLEYLKEIDSNAAKKFEDYLYKNTE